MRDFLRKDYFFFPMVGLVIALVLTAGIHFVAVEWMGAAEWGFTARVFAVAWLIFSAFFWLMFSENEERKSEK